jgi:hypothetical protein
MTNRDTILVIGPSASGKTHVLNCLRDEAAALGIPLEEKPITDSHTIRDRMLQDDTTGGFGHYHNPEEVSGHNHKLGQPTVPFTLIGNKIPHGMMDDFFTLLMNHSQDGKLHFAEWSGGINTNNENEPASSADLSFTTIGRMLKEGKLPRQGLERVLAVIHPITPEEVRQLLNKNRKVPTPDEIEFGRASWFLQPAAMKIFGRDDAQILDELFRESGIERIYHVPNDGENGLRGNLNPIMDEIFTSLRQPGIESDGPPRKEI